MVPSGMPDALDTAGMSLYSSLSNSERTSVRSSISEPEYILNGINNKRPRNAANKNVKTILWKNVSALMRRDWGTENINRLARDVRVSPATISRIKEATQSTRIGTVAKIAHRFNVEAWELLKP
jgi:hypothetical protein